MNLIDMYPFATGFGLGVLCVLLVLALLSWIAIRSIVKMEKETLEQLEEKSRRGAWSALAEKRKHE